MNPSVVSFEGVVSLIGRVLLAAIFVISGLSKIADPASTINYLKAVGMPLPAIAYGLTVLLEVVGGVLLIAGYRVRPIAIALAAFSVVAAVLFHGQLGDQNQFAHLLKNVSMAGGLLFVAALGAGSISVDQRRALRAAPAAQVF